MALAPSVFERCDDSSGRVIGVFREACSDIGDVALKTKADPAALADRAFEALIVNNYGQFDELIRVLALRAVRQVGRSSWSSPSVWDPERHPSSKPDRLPSSIVERVGLLRWIGCGVAAPAAWQRQCVR